MFRGDRNKGDTSLIVGAVCASVIVGTCVLIYALGVLNGGLSERRIKIPAAYRQAAKGDAESACAGRESSTTFECVYEKVESSQEQARAEQDLSAQQRAANGALWSAIIAFLSLMVTGVGVWFVKRTLDATLEAVKDTGEATNEMREANKIAIRQSRPWIDFEIQPNLHLTEYSADNIRANISVIAKNYGQNPCIVENVEYRLIYEDYQSSSDGQFIENVKQQFIDNPPKKAVFSDLIVHGNEQRYDDILSSIDHQSNGMLWLVAVVRVVYKDSLRINSYMTIRTFSVVQSTFNYEAPYIKVRENDGSFQLNWHDTVPYPKGSHIT